VIRPIIDIWLKSCRWRGISTLLLSIAIHAFCGTSRAQEWEYLGLPNQPISAIALQDDQTIYVSSPRLLSQTAGMISKTTNAGATWDTVLYDAGTVDLKMHPDDSEILYAGLASYYPPYGILKTTNGGASWFHADSGIHVNSKNQVRVIESDPAFPETLYAGTSGIFGGDFYKSTNGGWSWTSISGLTLTGGVISVAIDPFTSSTVYAGTSYQGLFKSTDGGSSWILSLQTNNGIEAIGIDPIDSDILYCAVGNPGSGFHRSTDGGVTWSESITGLTPNKAGGSLAVNKESRDLFVVMFPDSVGLFKSTDLGITWVRMNGLVADTHVRALTISPNQTRLYAGISNLGVSQTTVVVSSVAEEDPFLQSRAMLLRNHPNPFNSTTNVEFELPVHSYVSLRIFDVLGREVSTLVDGEKTSGRHQVLFDAKGLASGIYFSRLRAGDHVVTRKMILSQ